MSMADYLYCSRRADEEDSAARSTTCAVARLRHEELAEAYRRRCALSATQLQGSVLPLIGPAVAAYSRNRRQPSVARSAPALADSAATEPVALVHA